jgi:integrase
MSRIRLPYIKAWVDKKTGRPYWRFRRRGYGDVRLHDLRHSFASFAVQSGGSLFLIGKVLGHRQARTTERYAHTSDEPLLATAELAARRHQRLLEIIQSLGTCATSGSAQNNNFGQTYFGR